MTIGRCPFTGRPADDNHHPTGRGPDGGYYDPTLTIPLVRAQHVAEHVAWRVLGLDVAAGQSSSLALRLHRLGALLRRLGDHHASGEVTFPAEFVGGLGALLFAAAEEVDRE